MLCLLHTRYTYTGAGTVLHLGASRPSVPRRFAAGRMADHYAPPAASLPGSLPRSLGPTALFPHSPCERQRERGTGGRGGRLLMAADVTLYTITCDPWARQGWEGWVASTPKQESQHLPSLLGSISPLASSLPLLLFISFISTEQCMRGTCYGNGWHACAWTHNTARSGCCSSGLPRENESGFW